MNPPLVTVRRAAPALAAAFVKGLVPLVLVVMCALSCGQRGPEPGDTARHATSEEDLGESASAATNSVCEDVCSECGELRCRANQSDGQSFLCVPNGGNCPPSGYPRKTLLCVCCGDNECRVGNPQTGYCQACPNGQRCDHSRNQCCTPLTRSQACGNRACGTVSDDCDGTISCGTCATGRTCTNGCCAKTCRPLLVGETCGTPVDNGCGGTITCSNCPANSTCSNAVCACRSGYRDCGGMCWPTGHPCP